MTQAYNPAYVTFGNSLTTAAALQEQERIARQNEAYAQFYGTLNSSYQSILTPEQQARYNQLWNQYRGYDAVLDPTTSKKLKLTEAQIQQLRQYDAEYQKQMGTLLSQYGTKRDDAIAGYNKLWPQVNNQINQVLTEEQRRQWTEQSGSPYRFQPFYGYTTPTAPIPPAK